ncbi:Transcriptional regulatory protein moc3 [Escovopsis weberi]|uniref:Transcriptional regulatory protein moc3 n=1 Tax=Escovopsis weberi TaxID=150374 RepID=A0A0M9VU51_ESCWE|nr:Transcriptional regulatory protein moc3 [Escovopsis weberi]
MKAKQGCWTCKRRKIGCDRALPVCNNCSRTERKCLGYGIRLLWPDRHDGRRKDAGIVVYDPSANARASPEQYGQHFLNFTYDDVSSAGEGRQSKAVIRRPPPRSLELHAPMIDGDAMFMSYYEKVLAPMISTTQVRNGFRTALLPMVLSGDDSSSKALWNSMMAVSAFHLSGIEAAFKYKTNAIRHLSASLSSPASASSADVSETQLAASMMLCIYNVFDETEGNWTLHLDGAKHMLSKVYRNHQQRTQGDFFFTWFLYHEVLACFTQPHRVDYGWLDFVFLDEPSDLNVTLILGPLGCSLEIMAIIQRLNTLRDKLILKQADATSPSMLDQRAELEHRLVHLVQCIDPDGEAFETPARRSRILITAELYRLGALLYLLHVCPIPGDNDLQTAYLEQAFAVFDSLKVVTSPWPVFIIACSCEEDEQRIKIMQTLDLMNTVRNIGNIRVMRHIIEICWKLHDLHSGSNSAREMRFWDFINYETAVPWFI